MAKLPGSARAAQYTATASQTTFIYGFKITSDDEIKVQQGDDTLTLTTEYTVTGSGEDAGGTIVLVTGATVGDIITVTGDTYIERGTTFTDGGPYKAVPINGEYDRLDYIASETLTQQSQSLGFDPIQLGFDATIPTPVATRAIKVNDAGDGFVMSDSDPDDAITYAAEAAASAAAALISENAAAASAVDSSGFATASSGFATASSDSADDAEGFADSINPAAFGSDFIPDADGTRDLGSAAKEWGEVHATDGYIYNDLTVVGDVTAAGKTLRPFLIATVEFRTDYNINGGSFNTAGTWETRPISSILTDDIGISLSSNVLTLPAGTYKWSGAIAFRATNWTKFRVYQTSGTPANLGDFTSTYSNAPGTGNGSGVFTIASSEDIELQMNASTQILSTGMGEAHDTAAMGDNIFLNFILEKIV